MNRFFGLLFIFWFPLSAIGQQESVIERRFRVSDSLAMLGMYDNAIRALDSIIVYFPEVVEAYKRTIALEEKRNNFSGAFEAATGWVAVAPEDYEANIRAGWYAMLSGRSLRAGHFLHHALKISPFNDRTYRYWMYFYLLQDNRNKIVEYMIKTGFYAGNNSKLIQDVNAEFSALGKWVKKMEYDSAYIVDFLKKQAVLNSSLSSTRILDSIKNMEYKGINKYEKQLIQLKEKFITAENKVPENSRRIPLIAQCYMDLAAYEFHWGSKEKFNYNLNQATIEWMNYNDLEGLAYNYIHLVKMLTPDYPLGHMLKLAFLAGQKMNDKNIMVQSYHDISGHFFNYGNIDSALYYLTKSYSIALDASDNELYYFKNLKKEAIYKTTIGLNRIYRNKNNLDSALYYGAIAGQHHHNPRSTLHIFNEAMTYQDCRDYTKAKIIYEKIIKDTFSFKSNPSGWIVYSNLGRCYLKLGDFVSAQAYLIKSLYPANQTKSIAGYWEDPVIIRGNTLNDLKLLFVKTNNADSLFNIGELERKSTLHFSNQRPEFMENGVTLSKVQKSLKPDEACIQYFGHNENGIVMLVFNNSKKLIIEKSNEELNKIFLNESLKAISEKIWEEATSYAKQFGLDIPSSEKIRLLISQFTYRYNLNVGKYRNTRSVKLGAVKGSENIDHFKAIEAYIYEIFFNPAKPLLTNTKTLFLNTAIESQFIPFDVLKDQQGKFLAESYAITYVPSFSFQSSLKSKPGNSGQKMLMIGNPDYGQISSEAGDGRGFDLKEWGYNAWTELPGTAIEMESIQSILHGATILQRENLSESVLKQYSKEGALKNYNILHFALHGLSPIDGYEYMSLIVTDNTGENDGFLQFQEIVDLDLNADLVCLSACETALPSRDMRGLTYYNMSDAFMYAGAKCVLASSWKIDDDATAVFMKRFYENLFESNKNYAYSLQKTKLEFIRGEHKPEWKSPAYWGAFKLIGY